MKLHLVFPALPPALNGVGDYTAHLATTLCRQHEVTVLTSTGYTPDALPNVAIQSPYNAAQHSSYWNLLDVVRRDQPDWLILQYVPFSFGRRGYNLTLPRVMHAIAKKYPRTRIAMMAHETYMPSINFKFAVMATWQKWQFHSLLKAVDVTFVSTERWADQAHAKYSDLSVVHLPVGSNMPRVEISKPEARRRLNIEPDRIVLGVFGTAHISRPLGVVRQAIDKIIASGRKVLLLYIGPDGAVMRSHLEGIDAITDGPLPADEVSRRLAAIDIALATYIDGVSTRRGACIAGLQHGLPTVATRGFNTDSLWNRYDRSALLLSDVSNEADFCANVLRLAEDESARQAMSLKARAFFEDVFSWDRVAEKMIHHLQAAPTRRA